MNRHSLFFSIFISFFISLILVGISYFLLLQEITKKEDRELFRKYQPITRIFHHMNSIEEISATLHTLGYKLVTEKKIIRKVLVDKNLKRGFAKKSTRMHFFQLYTFQGENYIFLQTPFNSFLIKDTINEKNSSVFYISVAFLVIFAVLIFSFFITIKKLYPLKILQNNIKDFGDENFNVLPPITDKKDEVSLLANEFTKSANKIKNIQQARNVFFRNIMHELKTPITKGKFLLELENTQENKNKIQDIFSRLDTLINEFAAIESLSSKTKNMEKGSYFIADIIENVQDILLLDEEDLNVNIENEKIDVNFKFFSIAIKNLVDNALKYSPQNKATIYNKGANIFIENIGEKLPKELKEYKEPYGGIDKNKPGSFGLGLYIVFNILEANDYMLEYLHVKGVNRFTCKKINYS